MASTQLLVSTPKVQLEDPLSYLPRSAVTEYGKGETIYGESAAIPYLFLVVDGRVMVSRFKSRDSYFIIDIYQRDEFFGESVFLRSLLSNLHFTEQTVVPADFHFGISDEHTSHTRISEDI